MAETPLTELETALNDLLSALGVDPPENTRESLATVTDALSVTAEATDETVGMTTDRLQRALSGAVVSGDVGDSGVIVGTFTETAGYAFDVRYVLGVTDNHPEQS